MVTQKVNTAGGAATAGGTGFQARVAAWFAVQVLAEHGAPQLLGLPTGVCPEFVRCESAQSVDDILVGTSDSGFVFVQAKRRISASSSPQSEFASVISQFVRQFLSCCKASGPRPWERPLDLDRDRLVLATTSGSPGTIRFHLPSVLNRLKGLVSGQPLDDAASNRQERTILDEVLLHARNTWQAEEGAVPKDEDLVNILSLVEVLILDVEQGGAQEREADALLISCVLRSPTDAVSAWSHLVGTCLTLATQQNAASRRALQRDLAGIGLRLNATRSFQEDVDRIKAFSRRIQSRLLGRSRILGQGNKVVKIERRVRDEICARASSDSFLVVGEDKTWFFSVWRISMQEARQAFGPR